MIYVKANSIEDLDKILRRLKKGDIVKFQEKSPQLDDEYFVVERINIEERLVSLSMTFSREIVDIPACLLCVILMSDAQKIN